MSTVHPSTTISVSVPAQITTTSSDIDPETQPLLVTHHYYRDHRSTHATMPVFYTLATLFGASSVILGAFGAHGLKRRINDPARLANWSTAAQYQLMHSAVLLAMSLTLPRKAQRVPGILFVTGITLFSGSLYLLVLDHQKFRALGPVTPIGGVCLIAGWIALGIAGRRFVPIR